MKKSKMNSKMSAKNGNAMAKRQKKNMGSMPKKTKGYARGGVVNPSYSGDMPRATPN